MGHITKAQYVIRRQLTQEELQRAKPPNGPDLDRAQALLEDFARFWDAEPEPAERRKLSSVRSSPRAGRRTARSSPSTNTAFASYFTAASEVRAKSTQNAGRPVRQQ